MNISNNINPFLVNICVFFLVTSQANAAEHSIGVFVEPSAHYEMSDTTVNYPSPLSSSDGSANGFGVGARLGLHLHEMFFVGLDGRYSIPEFKDTSVNYTASSKSMNWGPVVGLQMAEIGLRFWGSYIIDGNLNPDENNGVDIEFRKAKGFRLGTGFRLSVVSLNLEYQDVTYEQTNLQQLGPFAPDADLSGVELENKSWILSISMPLEL